MKYRVLNENVDFAYIGMIIDLGEAEEEDDRTILAWREEDQEWPGGSFWYNPNDVARVSTKMYYEKCS